MNSTLPDPSVLAAQADNAEWLQKELAARRLQKEFNGSQTHDEKLREAAKGFESIFIQKLWTQMRKTVPKEGYLHSKEEDYYISMFDKDMAEKLADAGGIGLGDMLYRQLKGSQEDASRVTSPSGAKDPKPIKDLVQEYDPQALRPPEARNAKLDTSLAAMEPDTELDPRDMTSLYAPMEGYEEQGEEGEGPAEGASEEPAFPGEHAQAAAAQDEALEKESLAHAAPRPQGPELEFPEAPSVPQGAEQLARAGEEYRQNREVIETDPEVLAAVEALARRIAPGVSPAAREQRTRLPGGEAAAATSARDASFSGSGQQVRLLEDGIRRSQGAMENHGGRETAEAGASSAPAGNAPGEPFHWPVDGRQTSPFGWRRSALTGERVFHQGLDLAAEEGAPVASCWDGEVTFTGKKPGLGQVVVVEHAGGWESLYGHNGEISVQPGDSVKAGQKIASVGSTGSSTGPHLHFEIRHEGAAFDPVKIQNSLASSRATGRGA